MSARSLSRKGPDDTCKDGESKPQAATPEVKNVHAHLLTYPHPCVRSSLFLIKFERVEMRWSQRRVLRERQRPKSHRQTRKRGTCPTNRRASSGAGQRASHLQHLAASATEESDDSEKEGNLTWFRNRRDGFLVNVDAPSDLQLPRANDAQRERTASAFPDRPPSAENAALSRDHRSLALSILARPQTQMQRCGPTLKCCD
jgi:hypothetical protein